MCTNIAFSSVAATLSGVRCALQLHCQVSGAHYSCTVMCLVCTTDALSGVWCALQLHCQVSGVHYSCCQVSGVHYSYTVMCQVRITATLSGVWCALQLLSGVRCALQLHCQVSGVHYSCCHVSGVHYSCCHVTWHLSMATHYNLIFSFVSRTFETLHSVDHIPPTKDCSLQVLLLPPDGNRWSDSGMFTHMGCDGIPVPGRGSSAGTLAVGYGMSRRSQLLWISYTPPETFVNVEGHLLQ